MQNLSLNIIIYRMVIIAIIRLSCIIFVNFVKVRKIFIELKVACCSFIYTNFTNSIFFISANLKWKIRNMVRLSGSLLTKQASWNKFNSRKLTSRY